MQDWHVWDVVPVAECWCAAGQASLQGKWVDINKGDWERPVVRSRDVAKEFANTKSDDFFSPTPPLEALRLFLSHAGSGKSSSTGGCKVLVTDSRKAHLHAFAKRNLHVTLQPKIWVPNMCTTEAKFTLHLRRTCDMGSFSLKAAGKQGICKRVGQSMPLSTQQQRSD